MVVVERLKIWHRSWSPANLVKVNVAKSTCMLIGSKRKFGNKSFNVSLGGELIPSVNNVKYVGVYIDRFLKYDIHINYTIQR